LRQLALQYHNGTLSRIILAAKTSKPYCSMYFECPPGTTAPASTSPPHVRTGLWPTSVIGWLRAGTLLRIRRNIAETSGPPMYEAVTRGIRVRATPQYLEEESAPEDDRFFWAYTIDISNEGS